MTIYKYELTSNICTLNPPEGAEFLSVGCRTTMLLVVWAKVDPDAMPDLRFLCAYTTGDKLADGPSRFIGTVTTSNGIVWHVFEEPHPSSRRNYFSA